MMQTPQNIPMMQSSQNNSLLNSIQNENNSILEEFINNTQNLPPF